ncbi:MAG: MbcA/ParS/Xre antitoxin family protein [Betaproteobacteria bacterium]
MAQDKRPESPWHLSRSPFEGLSAKNSEPGLNATANIPFVVIGGQTIGAANQPSYDTGRLTGPVAVLKSLAGHWHLDEAQVAALLKLGPHQSTSDLFRGVVGLVGDDQRHRAGYLITIYGLLSSIFRDQQVARSWLTEKKQIFGGMSPLERMLKGTMEDMLAVKHLVETMAGQ